MYLVFRRIFQAAVPAPRWAIWYPVANVVVDLILIRALMMCLTGKVTWRGTDYGNSGRSILDGAIAGFQNRVEPDHAKNPAWHWQAIRDRPLSAANRHEFREKWIDFVGQTL